MQRVTFDTPIGRCAIAWHDAGLTGFHLPDAPILPDDLPAPPPEIAAVIDRVRRHLSGQSQDFCDLRYDFSELADFNLRVLRATLDIKSGHTRSYGEIAEAIAELPVASRAVGAALGANRWPLLIPCHRVVSSEGKMIGFSGPGGVKTKLRLLALEGAQLFSE